jgi:asparagine synthase (glutamine-hydrolysing)
MCGIAGAVSFEAPVDPGQVRAMCDCLVHRGPDDERYFTSEDRRVVFGFRRLAIVDLETGGQPVVNEDGTVVSMLNGEIYNHTSLRAQLADRGHSFTTDHADSEVIPHGYEEWGDGVFDRLQGMFAIALWDARGERLLLARDRLGEKPLYLRHDGGSLRFGSELEPMLTAGDSLDPDALALYLTYQYIPAPRTICAGVTKLRAGELAVFSNNGLSTSRYWAVPKKPPQTTADQVVNLVRDSVSQRLMGDVPVGAFLSGGVDSSVITALMREALGGAPVHTFSIGFADPLLDETAAAESVASAIGTTHHVLRTDELNRQTAEAALRALGEPLADAAAVPTYILAEYARQWVKVVLTGEGADELFGGYMRYRNQHRLRFLLSAPLPVRRLVAAVVRASGDLGGQVPARLPDLLDSPTAAMAREWRAVMPKRMRRSLLGSAWAPREDPILEASARFEAFPTVPASFAIDLATWVADDLLVKVDRSTMAFGLEARPPYLDHQLVEAVLGLPLETRWSPGRDKPVLRDFAAMMLPPATAGRPKQTFTTPAAAWLRGPLEASNAEAGDALVAAGMRWDAIRSITDPSLRGGRDRGQWAWTMYVLGRWLVDHPQISIPADLARLP